MTVSDVPLYIKDYHSRDNSRRLDLAEKGLFASFISSEMTSTDLSYRFYFFNPEVGKEVKCIE